MIFQYQQTRQFFAQISGGIEELGVQELSELGATDITPAFRGIYFKADNAALYRINYCGRLITRVLAPLISFPCRHPDILYKKAKSIQWNEIFTTEQTFAVFANLANSSMTHSQYAGLRLKDAIADAFREKFGKRPNVETMSPDIWINLYIEKDQAVISIDTSKGSLHRRGYRKEAVEAPMQETVAAAVIRLSEWDGSVPLHDPMCGAGTLLCEALMHYCRMPAGILRNSFGFEFLPDYDANLWKSEKEKADKKIRRLPTGKISGSDISRIAIESAKANAKMLRNGEKINFYIKDFQNIRELKNSVIVCNPPYGVRLRTLENLDDFYKALGDFLKQKCKDATAYIYFGNRELIKKIGLKPSWKKPLSNGGLDGRLVKYEIH